MYFKRVLTYLFLVTGTILIFGGCTRKTTSRVEIPPVAGAPEQEERLDTQILGVIKEINTERKVVTLFSTNDNKDVTLYYSGGTDIIDKYKQVIAISQINVGEMVDVYYNEEMGKIGKMQVSNNAWEYQGVKNFRFDKTNKVVKISDKNYKYENELVIADRDNLISLIDINDRDVLTIKGVGGKVYSIIVTKGHGYIRFKNYEDFVGGNVEIGYHIMEPVTENMLIVAGEGTYKVTMENGELRGTKSAKVARNEEITIDMGDFNIEKDRVGMVEFDVTPENATIYVNGRRIKNIRPIRLNYGKHDVKAKLSGYTDYSGILTVGESYQTIYINLTEETEQAGSRDSQTADASANAGSTGTKITKPEVNDTKIPENTKTINKLDTEHSIKISKPEGAEVYLNGTFKGIAPCSFTKEIGTHTITLSKTGYNTKSFTIEVLDDKKEVTFSFPEMVKLD